MVQRIVGWFVLVPLCAALIVFALANRQLVVVNFNPLIPPDALSAPGFGVPLALEAAVRDGRIRRGQKVLLEGVGGGFTWGAVLLEF